MTGVQTCALPICESQNPLWVTAIGIEVTFAAERVKEMAGEFRVPGLLKMVDGRCREWNE